jgi:Ca2+-binding RTX toxin-like protein
VRGHCVKSVRTIGQRRSQFLLFGVEGEDVLYGGDGDDYLDGRDRGVKDNQRDELYCGAGRDQYIAGSRDYVSSSCEKGTLADTGGPTLILLAGVAILSTGLMLSRSAIRPAS